MKRKNLAWLVSVVCVLLFSVSSARAALPLPGVSLSDVVVEFITARDIRVTGKVQFFDLYPAEFCGGQTIHAFHVSYAEGSLQFEYTSDNGEFPDFQLFYQTSNTEPLPYHWTDGHASADWEGPLGAGPVYFSYPVTDVNDSGWWLDLGYRDWESCGNLLDPGDSGKVFSFDEQFTIPDLWATPNREYRVTALLEWMVADSLQYGETYYIRATVGPFPVPQAGTTQNAGGASVASTGGSGGSSGGGSTAGSGSGGSGGSSSAGSGTGGGGGASASVPARAVFDASTGTLHVPLLDAGNLGGMPGETWWFDLGLDSLNGAPVFVLDLAHGVGGIGGNLGMSPLDTEYMAAFDPAAGPGIHIPSVDIGTGDGYRVDLALVPTGDGRIVFSPTGVGAESLDFSGGLGLPCAEDADFVRSLYQSVLDRDLDVYDAPGHGAAHLQSLRDGNTREALTVAFFDSAEYTNAHKSDEEFMRDAYQAVLSREPLDWEMTTGVGPSRDDFVLALLHTAEYRSLIAGCP